MITIGLWLIINTQSHGDSNMAQAAQQPNKQLLDLLAGIDVSVQTQHPINLLEGLDLAGQDQQTNQAPINLLEGFTGQPTQQPQAQEQSFSDQAIGVAENIASFASGTVAEPIAGIAGIVQTLNPFADEGAGAAAVEATREALTFKPSTEAGQDQAQAIGETLAPVLAPVGKALSKAEKFLGEEVLELTGSPSLAAIAHTLPTVALELLGFKGSKQLTKAKSNTKAVNKAITESLPEVKQLREASKAMFKEIDEMGVGLTTEPQRNFSNSLINKIESVHGKKAAAALQAEIKDSLGISSSGTVQQRIGDVKESLLAMADDVTLPEKEAIRNTINTEFDKFIGGLKAKDLQAVGDSKPDVKNLRKVLKSANTLDARATRSELLNGVLDNSNAAGVKKSLTSILKDKDISKRFSADELKVMDKVAKGDFKEGLASFIGKFGVDLSAKQSIPSLLGAGVGVATLGTAGLAIPVVGTAAKQVAKTLTTNKVKFIDKMNRAGTNAEAITKAYFSTVPKKDRSIRALSDLLADPSIDIDAITDINNGFIQDALNAAKGKRAINLATGAAAGTTGQTTKAAAEQQEPINYL